MDKGSTYLSQTHCAEKILRTYNFWNATPRLTPIQPKTHLNKDDCDKNSAPDFHRRYHGIVGSLQYLVTMTHPDLAWAYSKLRLRSMCNFEESTTYLLPNTFCLIFAALGIKLFAILVIQVSRKPQRFVGLGRCRLGRRY